MLQTKSKILENILLWFFPTRYFQNEADLKEWQESYRKEYAVFARVAALAAMLVSIILYVATDVYRLSGYGFVIVVLYRILTVSVGAFIIFHTFTEHFKTSKFYKLPALTLALIASFFESYLDLKLDPTIPLYYVFLIPFLGVWICQFSSGLSAIILTLILIPISVAVVAFHGFEPFYFYNAVSLTILSVPLLFLMRLEMLNKIKYFVISKKYLEETELRLEETKLRYNETERRYKELGELATQVAHDIRSPLSAVMVLSKDNPNIPEDSRLLFRAGVTRILDITNELLKKGKDFLSSTNLPQAEPESLLVYPIVEIVESLVSEKRVEYRSKLDVQIQTNISLFGIFANIQKSELKRILSNLINNAVEAVKNKGRVEIGAELLDGMVQISVVDDGVGIPAEVVPKLFQRGASFNKGENNLGLGLYHAHTKIVGWGGRLSLSSEVGKGTKVILSLPVCEAPSWFADKILIKPNSRIVILDDDLAIHKIWDKRFSNLELHKKNVEVIHLSTVQQFELLNKNVLPSDTLYLMDYELLDQPKNGVDIILEFGIQKHIILVTGRSEEENLLTRCSELNIKVLPKISVDLVPIFIG